MLKIERVGLLANLVDSGRKSKQSEGFCESGPIDSVHFAYVNALLGQPLDNCAIEIIGGQFSCSFFEACLICVSGAKAPLMLNDLVIANNTVFHVKAGDTLHIGELESGFSQYIGLTAKVDAPLFAHSACAVAREGSGGLRGDGSALKVGDEISFKPPCLQYSDLHELMQRLKRTNTDTRISPALNTFKSLVSTTHKALRINLAYQASFFSQQQIAQFCLHPYTISAQSDRMGMRLKGDTILCQKQVLSSQAIVLGAVQIPGDGKPIIMRQDRQTIGGYPIIGVVDYLSVAILGQAKPGDTVQFVLSDFEYSRQQTWLVFNELQKIAKNRAKALFN